MPFPDQIVQEQWLLADELQVCATEFELTGFYGSLIWFRSNTDGTNSAEIGLFSGRTIDVPVCFIAGAADWAVYRKPDALKAMQTKAGTKMEEPHPIDAASRWVQQLRPRETSDRMLAFHKALPSSASGTRS